MVAEKDLDGGIGSINMLYRSNLLLLMGGGEKPRFPPRTLVFWDDLQNRTTGTQSFKHTILEIKFRKDL